MKKITPYILLVILLAILAGCRKTSQADALSLQTEMKTLFDGLKAGYGAGDTVGGISLMQRMLAMPVPKDETRVRHIYVLNKGFQFLMYRYVYAERSDNGFRYFLRLANDENPPLPVPDGCKRQVLICAAYLGMQSGDMVSAVTCLERGLQLPPLPTPDERYINYTFAGAVYSQADGMLDKSIEMYERAYAEAQLSNEKGTLPWIMSNLAELYAYEGQFEKAIEMLYDALEVFKSKNDYEGASGTCVTLTQLFQQWGMMEQADQYADEAVDYAIRSGYDYYIGLSMLEKYEMAKARQQTDSALYWIQRADSFFVVSNSPVEHLNAQGAAVQLLLQDSTWLDEGTRQLERICSDTLISGSVYQAVLQNRLGQCYLQQGRSQEGVRLIESSLSQLEENRKDVLMLEAYETLIGHFRKEKAYRAMLAYQDKAAVLRKKLFEEEKLHQVTASRIHYETTQKELENKLLQQEVESKQRTLIFTWLLVGLLAALLVSGGLYLRQRQRYLRRISDARLSQISGLLHTQKELKDSNDALLRTQEELRQSNVALSEAQQELSRHNASLAQELHVTSHELKKTSHQLTEVSSRLDSVSKQKATSDIRVKISTELFNSDKEAEFRRSFTAIYPDYLPYLHRLSTDMTSTDELIAMLLLLELSNNEIALTLGISKNGVNKARSRMRQRLGLKSEIVLEEFLKEISN